MAEKQRLGERHPTVPHLYRKLGSPTPGEILYPYLPSGRTEHQRYQPPAEPTPTKGLLPHATRGGVSPLGGVAKPSK
jgi:hypothetical protein